MKQEDEDQEEARKKDEAQKAEEAMARGDIRDVGEAVPMAVGDQKAALVKALQMISARNVSLAAMCDSHTSHRITM